MKGLKDTSEYWVNWAHSCEIEQCIFSFEWHELITRSGLVLKLLTHKETGAIYAASTTSLPKKLTPIQVNS